VYVCVCVCVYVCVVHVRTCIREYFAAVLFMCMCARAKEWDSVNAIRMQIKPTHTHMHTSLLSPAGLDEIVSWKFVHY